MDICEKEKNIIFAKCFECFFLPFETVYLIIIDIIKI